jgi:hypothetical protein
MTNRGMMTVYVTLVLILSTCAAQARSGAGQQAGASSPRQELIDLQKAVVNAQENGDAEYLKNAVADDFMAIETNGNATEKSDFARVERPEHPGPAPVLYEFKVLQLDEDCAVVSYKAVFPGSQLERYQHVSDTWVKEDGRWKLKFQQSTLNLWSAHDLD